MTTKTAGKAPRGRPNVGPSQDDLQAAYRVHTLANMLYGHMVATYPWVGAQPQMMGMATFDPTMGQMATPWAYQWPVAWYNPMGQMEPSCYFGSELPR